MSVVELRPLEAQDMALVAEWLGRDHVARWWGDPSEALAAIREHDAEATAIIAADGRPVGLICWQAPSASELAEAGLSDLPSNLIDVDIMIGEPEALGRGIGPAALGQLFEQMRARGVDLIGMAAALANTRSLAAIAKAGLLPFRDFTENGVPYRYFTQRTGQQGPVAPATSPP